MINNSAMIDELTDQLLSLERVLAVSESTYSNRADALAILTSECLALTGEIDLVTKVNQALLFISNKVLAQSTDVIDRLVTLGLKSVFDDLSLEFKTSVDKLRGRTALRFELWQDGHTVPLTDSYGGGVLSVVGVLLRVVTIIVLKLNRILLLDESLSFLHSPRYIASAGVMLKRLAKDLNFTILMVTDDGRFAENADVHYTATLSDCGAGLQLKKES